MDALRLSLIVIGIVIIAFVWWWSRRLMETKSMLRPSSRQTIDDSKLAPFEHEHAAVSDTLQQADSNSPTVSTSDIDEVGKIVPERRQADGDTSTHIPNPTLPDFHYETSTREQLIISLTLLGRHGRRFNGTELREVMRAFGLEYGDKRIFHDMALPAQRPVISVANLVEPGIFHLEQMDTFETPGLVIFMQLPGPLEARAALDRLVELGRKLAARLDGDLCDESRSILTQQRIGYLKEQVEAYRFKQKMSKLGHSRSDA